METPTNSLTLSRWDGLAALTFIGLAVAWVLLSPGLPARVPTHFDLADHANGWTPLAMMPWLIFGLPFGNWLLFWFMDLALKGTEQAPRLAAHRPLRGLMTLGMGGISVALLLIPSLGPWVLWPALGFLFLCLGVGLWKAWQARVPLPVGQSEDHWKWGMIYVNPEDPRIWLPKRIGLGWTLNFGRPMGWLMLLLMLALPLGIVLLVSAR